MSFRCKISSQGIIERPELRPPPMETHKYARGSAVVVSGPVFRTGAARLAAQAALSVGAGLVTLVGDPNALHEHAAQVTAIMLREKDEAFTAIDERVRAVAIGPGAGLTEELAQDVAALLLRDIPIVLDADALTVFAAQPEMLFAMLHPSAVLTPHEGEFARLFPDINLEDRNVAARAAAARAGAVILLKGAETIVAAPDGRFATNRHSASWLATAGAGDVLTGLICGLLAQGQSAFEAACIAAWVHGDIGVRAGPGLTADSMQDWIPLVLSGCLSDEKRDDKRLGP